VLIDAKRGFCKDIIGHLGKVVAQDRHVATYQKSGAGSEDGVSKHLLNPRNSKD
jgi:hypothetical protein